MMFMRCFMLLFFFFFFFCFFLFCFVFVFLFFVCLFLLFFLFFFLSFFFFGWGWCCCCFFLIFFIKAYVVGTHLNCIDKLQFKWAPTTLCLYKEVQWNLDNSNLRGPKKFV